MEKHGLLLLTLKPTTMAEITTGSKPQKGHRKILSTRIDLTPMVDLGFLLLTFFVFTTTLAKANAMRLLLPKDDPNNIADTKTPQSGALTIIADENQVWYYNGVLEDAIKKGQPTAVNYNGTDGIRSVIMNLKKDLRQHKGNDSSMMIMIKALPASNFTNTIDLLDEMTINAVHRYMMVDLTKEEEKLVEEKKL